MPGRVDFQRINRAALPALPDILRRWFPDGRFEGHEFVARNPTRGDRRPGSFKINTRTGAWSDFATGDGGGDVISLAAYLDQTNQVQAARNVAHMLGIAPDG